MYPRAASIAPFYLGVGDHRIFVVDFPKDFIIGEGFVPLCKPSMRRLVSCQPKVVLNYLMQGEFLFTYHRIREKLDKIDR